MNLTQCHILSNGATDEALRAAVGDKEPGRIRAGYNRQHTLTNVTITPYEEGLVQVTGTITLHDFWDGDLFSLPDPPDNWPRVARTRSSWNPLRWFHGPTYETPYQGWLTVGEKEIHIVVSPTVLAGVPG